jgi:4-hydroxybenzoyl-CoA thioesterase
MPRPLALMSSKFRELRRAIMLTNTRIIRVQWGDCDPATIVFYPRYFEWFDASTILLFEKATGLTKIKMLEKYHGAGLALVEARAKFYVPSSYGDDISIETRVLAFRRSSFDMHHRVSKGAILALEGFESRVWTTRDANDNNKLKAAPIPAEVLENFNRA